MMKKFSQAFVVLFAILIFTGCRELAIDQHYVIYNGNGADTGTAPTDITGYEEGVVVTTLNNTGNLQKYNVVFSCWNTEPDGSGTDLDAGDKVSMGTDSLVLYAKWKYDFAVGDTGPSGGYIIYYDEADIFADWDYMEAAPSDFSTYYSWSLNNTTTSALGTGIGSGFANTLAIVYVEGIGNYAACRCLDLTIGNYSDWFLPSQEEMVLMSTNLYQQGIGNFEHSVYWSSTERDSTQAYDVSIINGNAGSDLKVGGVFVRAVRTF